MTKLLQRPAPRRRGAKPDSPFEGPPQYRRGSVGAWWLLLLVVPAAVLGAVTYSSTLRQHEHREWVEQSLLVRLRGSFASEHMIVAQAVAEPRALPAGRVGLETLSGQAEKALGSLRGAADGDDSNDRLQSKTLPRLYAAYRRTERRVLALLARGRARAGAAVFDGPLRVQFRALRAVIDSASAGQDAFANDAMNDAFEGDLVGYGFAGLVLLLVLARVAAVRRRLERRAVEERLTVATERYRQIVETANEGVWTLDPEGRTTFANRALAKMLACEPREMVGRSVFDFVDADWHGPLRDSLARRRAGVSEQLELRLRGRDRREVWTLVSGNPLYDADGRYSGALGVITDITERKQMETRLQYLADHDSLTGVYNRRRLIAELDRQLRYAERSCRGGAVLTFDLDNFKYANDTYGHATGDAMLRAVAAVLIGRARGTDIVARLGGDEFAVVLPEATRPQAVAFAREIRALLCERDVGPPIAASIGIATFGGGEQVTADELLVCADIALYEAKEHGGDQAKLYTGQAAGALSWLHRIRMALANDRFVLYGQPIVDLRTGRASHRELLIRMLSDDGDIIPPAAFLPTAERFGLIRAIDRWVTTAGLRLARDHPGVAINLSGYSIGENAVIESVRAALADGLDPTRVIFEITETAAMTNLNAARQFAGTLNGIGCALALDDFGTGFASFTYLKHIPAQYLKIDMEFVRDLADSETDRQVVKAIVRIAHSLGKLTIAEGVEDQQTVEILRSIGVDYGQGHHFGEPRRVSPPTTFERCLRRKQRRALLPAGRHT